jgi:hypothetical protein
MSIYKKGRVRSSIYRKIYQDHYGTIPVDEDGRTFEIHHIDGDDSNNDPTNLVALSIKDHYDLHYKQGDWMACWAMSERMKITPEERSDLGRKNAMKQVESGTNLFVNMTFEERSELGKRVNAERLANGTHNFQGPDTNKKRVDAGTHHFQGDNNTSKKRVEAGVHHFLGDSNPSHKRVADGTHNFVGKTREQHHRFDSTLYTFQHKVTKEIVVSTKYDFRMSRNNISHSEISGLVSGTAKSAKGWVLVK